MAAALLAVEEMAVLAIMAADAVWTVAIALLAAGAAVRQAERVQSIAALRTAADSAEVAVRDAEAGIQAARAAGDLAMASRLENLQKVLGDLRRSFRHLPLQSCRASF